MIILGQVPSKSNSYRIINIAGHSSLGKSSALKDYEQQFFLQCSARDQMIATRFRLDIDVYYSSDRPDLDNALKIVLDCLQSCRAIKNDRLCCEIRARKFVDRANPRIELDITPLIL